MAVMNSNIGFIGCGNMGEAIIGALIRSQIFDAGMVHVRDVRPALPEALARTYGVVVEPDNITLFMGCDIIVLAVKPQNMAAVLSEIASDERYGIRKRKLVISIAAGVTISSIENLLYSKLDDGQKKNLPVVRVMPNTPALVLKAMSGMSANGHCTENDVQTAHTILGAMGTVVDFEESQLHAVTAVSGSGPAYVFYFMEAMIQAGIELGLAPDAAVELTSQTFSGAVKLFEESPDSARVLREKVTSPGGTTEAALKLFESIDVKKHIVQGIHMAAKRSRELDNPS